MVQILFLYKFLIALVTLTQLSIECSARTNVTFFSQENLPDKVPVIEFPAEGKEEDDTNDPVDRVDQDQQWMIPVGWILPANEKSNNLKRKENQCLGEML